MNSVGQWILGIARPTLINRIMTRSINQTAEVNKTSVFMNRPGLYEVSGKIQTLQSLKFFEENTHKIKWKETGDTAIDVGCGDGGLTVYLKNYKPFENYNYERFVAVDLNENMLKYAKEHHGDNDIIFRQLNIERDDIPSDLIGAFNHVFSFFVLHYAKDQEKAFTNIYNLLKGDGDVIINFVQTTVLFSIFHILSGLPKWKTLLKRADEFMSPYHGVKDPVRALEGILKKCRYKNVQVKRVDIKEVMFHHDFINFVKSLEPFGMSDEVFDQFMEDFFAFADLYGLLTSHTINDILAYEYCYSILTIYANK